MQFKKPGLEVSMRFLERLEARISRVPPDDHLPVKAELRPGRDVEEPRFLDIPGEDPPGRHAVRLRAADPSEQAQ